jgi:hypothetical protein
MQKMVMTKEYKADTVLNCVKHLSVEKAQLAKETRNSENKCNVHELMKE